MRCAAPPAIGVEGAHEALGCDWRPSRRWTDSAARLEENETLARRSYEVGQIGLGGVASGAAGDARGAPAPPGPSAGGGRGGDRAPGAGGGAAMKRVGPSRSALVDPGRLRATPARTQAASKPRPAPKGRRPPAERHGSEADRRDRRGHAARSAAHDRGRGGPRGRRGDPRAGRAARGRRRATPRSRAPSPCPGAATARGPGRPRCGGAASRRTRERGAGEGARRLSGGGSAAASSPSRRSPASASLADERIVPQREVQEAEAELQHRRSRRSPPPGATLESLGVSREGGGGRPVRLEGAPIAGTVLERSVVRGQVVEPGRVLFKVGDLSRLWLVAHASERDALRVRRGLHRPRRVPGPARRVVPGARLPRRADRWTQARGRSRSGSTSPNAASGCAPACPRRCGCPWARKEAARGAGGRAAAARTTRGASSSRRARDDSRPGAWDGAATWGARSRSSPGSPPGDTVVVEGAFLLKAEGEKAEGEGGHHDH